MILQILSDANLQMTFAITKQLHQMNCLGSCGQGTKHS